MTDDLDRAIDGAVREMLDVEQPAGFRGRVLDRIEGGSPAITSGLGVASAFRRKIYWAAVPLAAAAIAILAVLLPRHAERPQPSVTVATSQPQPTIPPATPPVPEPVVAAARQPRPQPSRVVERAVVAAAFEPAAPVGTPIEPLTRIDPIVVAPLTTASIAPDEISLRPLMTITEVQVAPLNSPDRRN